MHNQPQTSMIRVPVAAFLAWLIPGSGHLYLGHRWRGMICLVTITVTFWTGVAIGGVRATVDPQQRKLWFVAQLCSGGNTMAAFALNRSITPTFAGSPRPPMSGFVGHWLSADVGVHYTGVAGLLNLLVILDTIARAEPTIASRRRLDRAPGVVP